MYVYMYGERGRWKWREGWIGIYRVREIYCDREMGIHVDIYIEREIYGEGLRGRSRGIEITGY